MIAVTMQFQLGNCLATRCALCRLHTEKLGNPTLRIVVEKAVGFVMNTAMFDWHGSTATSSKCYFSTQ